ncbi:organic cation transporter protein-like [Palaemon carinicauda]|uniref:organic cation transporter protein-like n=1 Tax=Palaemon carinicauda TaxID=392227 RepID=UPI0035B59220
MGSQLDSLLSQLGTGRWNVIHFVALSYCFSLPAYHTLAGAFFVPSLSHSCNTPSSLMSSNDSNGRPSVYPCSYVAISTISGNVVQEECSTWVFDNSTFSTTLTSEFKLVCGRAYLRATFSGIYMFGVLVGAPLTGLLADKYGRKPTVAIGSLMYSAIAIASCWLPSFLTLLTARFLMGTMHSTIITAGYILALEVSEPRLRSVMGIVLYLPWSMGTMALGGFAYFVRDWRNLQLLLSLLSLPFLPALLILDESPRWLVVRGYYHHALLVLQRAARWNKAVLPPPHRILQIVKGGQNDVSLVKPSEDNCKGNSLSALQGCFILLRTNRLRIITLSLYVNHLIVSMVYYGLTLSGGQLSNNPFAYMVLMGLVEVPAYTVVIPIVVRFGRRSPTVTFFLFSGVVLLALPFIPKGCAWVMVTMALLGKMTITSAYQILSLYSSELFPTEVRTWGTSTAFMMSRVGSVASPFITEYLGTLCMWAPSVVFGAASVVAGLATLALPETQGVALPDTIEHLEKRVNLTPSRNIFRFLMRDPVPSAQATRVNLPRRPRNESAVVQQARQNYNQQIAAIREQLLQQQIHQQQPLLHACPHPNCPHNGRVSPI